VLEVGGEVERPFMDRLQRKHPLLRFTALRDVNIASALVLKLQPGDEAVAADARTPLIVTGRRAGQPFVALAFDIRSSDLPLRIAWPMLLLNAIDSFTQRQSDYVSSNEAGRPIDLSLASDIGAAELVEPEGTRHAFGGTTGATFTPRQVGFHRLQQAGDSTLLAVNLPAGARVDLRVPDAAPTARSRSGRVSDPPAEQVPPWMILLLAALAVLSIEWVTYHRRWTV
jgi:hypothetical protein